MAAVADRPILFCTNPEEWHEWLEAHAEDSTGVRLQLRKKSGVGDGQNYAEALDVALCFGWIDGQAGSLDENYYLVGFSPRRTRSPWSQINQGHIARLLEAGRMRPRGIAEVERAKADGRWDAAYRQKDAPVPSDLQQALDTRPVAADLFSKLSSQNRFAILYRVSAVRRADTRAAKIAGFVAMLERGETPYPQQQG